MYICTVNELIQYAFSNAFFCWISCIISSKEQSGGDHLYSFVPASFLCEKRGVWRQAQVHYQVEADPTGLQSSPCQTDKQFSTPGRYQPTTVHSQCVLCACIYRAWQTMNTIVILMTPCYCKQTMASYTLPAWLILPPPNHPSSLTPPLVLSSRPHPPTTDGAQGKNKKGAWGPMAQPEPLLGCHIRDPKPMEATNFITWAERMEMFPS